MIIQQRAQRNFTKLVRRQIYCHLQKSGGGAFFEWNILMNNFVRAISPRKRNESTWFLSEVSSIFCCLGRPVFRIKFGSLNQSLRFCTEYHTVHRMNWCRSIKYTSSQWYKALRIITKGAPDEFMCRVQRFSEQTVWSVQTLSQWSSAAESKHSNCLFSLAGTAALNTYNYTRPPWATARMRKNGGLHPIECKIQESVNHTFLIVNPLQHRAL